MQSLALPPSGKCGQMQTSSLVQNRHSENGGSREAGGKRLGDTKERRGRLAFLGRLSLGPAYRAISGVIRVRASFLSAARLPGR